MTAVIEVEHISKAYKYYRNPALRLLEWCSLGRKKIHQLNWVLDDINFQVFKGEALGIVGMNGAGKSTLLKIITGTSMPTLGTVTVNGKVSALLELGLGFHPEFTGRQNAIIAGQLMGLREKAIKALLPEIIDFAELGAYFDKPLRIYSSGMKMRLGFSVGTAFKPDIMIVDEALSVGDSYFQHKCFKRLTAMRQRGMALLLVSHDSAVISAVCDRALLLHQGKIVSQGAPELVMNYYKALLADFAGDTIQQIAHVNNKTQIISGSGEASVIAIGLYNQEQKEVSVINVGDAVCLRILVQAKSDLPELTLGYEIKDVFGQAVFGTNTFHLQKQVTQLKALETVEFKFNFAANLGIGNYSISVALHAADTHLAKNYEWRDLACIFSVTNRDKQQFLGISWLPPQLEYIRELA